MMDTSRPKLTRQSGASSVCPLAAPPSRQFSFRILQPGDEAASLPDQAHALRAASAIRDGITPDSLLEGILSQDQIRAQMASALENGQAHTWLLAFDADSLSGYTRFLSWREDDGTWVYLIVGWVHPAWRGQGLGTALLDRMETTIREQVGRDHPAERSEFAANASATEHEPAALLEANGYTVAYTVLEMVHDPQFEVRPHPLSHGLDLRPVTPEHLPLIAQNVLDSYANEYENGRYSENPGLENYIETLRAARHDPSLWQVAWCGQRVAGQVMPVITNNRAEIFEVSVHPDFRRLGLGRVLLSRALLELRQRGVAEIRLYTNANFPTRAMDLYQSAGFHIIKEFHRYRKPLW